VPAIASRVSALLFGLLLAFVVAEVAARLFSRTPAELLLPLRYKHEELQRIAREQTYIRFDQDLGWEPTPGSKHVGGDITYRTNAAGLRAERDYPLAPPAGTRRWAAFGDSFTYCEEVEIEDCWTEQLERMKPGLEVLNFGVPGYGPDQAWLRYQRDGRAYQPCGVFIGFLVENINRVVNRFRPFYEPAGGLMLSKPRYLLDGADLELLPNPAASPSDLDDPEWVEATLGPHDPWYFPGVFVANQLDLFRVSRLARTAAFNQRRPGGGLEFTRDWSDQIAAAYRSEGEAYQVAGRVLIEFARQVQRDGAAPIVVVFGSDIELRALQRGGTKAHQPLLDWLAREAVPTIDVTDDLLHQARRSGTNNVVGNHYRPLGNKVVAQTITAGLSALTAGTCV
jgi:hypothetical protein